ncbi:glycoside hydrolase [Halarcobacter ebronensis]|uniref:Glycoside hydrolase n=1 Tax=Halarcobacter ebronensis TaxID=1462615 RepID=A0A4Q1AVH4_9BACT|nr:glycoside hydrolase [Halarcobacter ebronensis]
MLVKNYISNFLFFLLLLLIQGCSFNSGNITTAPKTTPSANLDYNKIYDNLITQYKDWKGVKYKYGGYSKKGIDCSAFVQRTFKEKLNLNLPRTTALQLEVGEEINTNSLITGDLIFFSTGFKTNHVGIYLKDGKFMHVSTKKGVIISRINNPYYSKHIKEIRRVLY